MWHYIKSFRSLHIFKICKFNITFRKIFAKYQILTKFRFDWFWMLPLILTYSDQYATLLAKLQTISIHDHISKRSYWDGHMFCLPHGEEEMVESKMLPSNGPTTTSAHWKLMLQIVLCVKVAWHSQYTSFNHLLSSLDL